MQTEIRRIINSMDVKQDREDAEAKAYKIFKFGPEAFEILTDLGSLTTQQDLAPQQKKKTLRAIIFLISLFISKHAPAFSKSPKQWDAIDLLYDLSHQGYLSANRTLHNLGFSDADILKRKLLSLPVVDKHQRDKTISLNEAVEEIKLSKNFSGTKGLLQGRYSLGKDGKRFYEIYKVENKVFALRSRKLL